MVFSHLATRGHVFTAEQPSRDIFMRCSLAAVALCDPFQLGVDQSLEESEGTISWSRLYQQL